MSSSRLLELGVGAGLLFYGYTVYQNKKSLLTPSLQQYEQGGGQTVTTGNQGDSDHINEQGDGIPTALIDPSDTGPPVDTKLPNNFYMPTTATTLGDLNAVTAAQITNQTGDTFNVSDYGVYNQQGQEIGYYDAIKNQTCYTLVTDTNLKLGGGTCSDGFVDMTPHDIGVQSQGQTWLDLSGATSLTDAYNMYKDNLFGCLDTTKNDGGCSAANLEGSIQPGMSNISLMPDVYYANPLTGQIASMPYSDAVTKCQNGSTTTAEGFTVPCMILDPSTTGVLGGSAVTDPQFDIFDPSEWTDYVLNTKVTANQSDAQLLAQFTACQGGDDATCANVEAQFGKLAFGFNESYAEYTGNQDNVISLQEATNPSPGFAWGSNWEFASPSGQPVTPYEYSQMLAAQWQS